MSGGLQSEFKFRNEVIIPNCPVDDLEDLMDYLFQQNLIFSVQPIKEEGVELKHEINRTIIESFAHQDYDNTILIKKILEELLLRIERLEKTRM